MLTDSALPPRSIPLFTDAQRAILRHLDRRGQFAAARGVADRAARMRSLDQHPLADVVAHGIEIASGRR